MAFLRYILIFIANVDTKVYTKKGLIKTCKEIYNNVQCGIETMGQFTSRTTA